METSIKAIWAAHKTKIIIAAAVLAVGSSGINNAANRGYFGGNNNQPMQQGNSYRQQNNPYGYGNNAYTGGNGYYAGGSNSAGYTSSGSSDDLMSSWEARQQVQDKAAENYDDYIRDQGNYTDGYGNTYKMSDQYENNYVNNTTGEYVQTNDPNYDPNAGSTTTWSAVTPEATTTESSGE